MNQRKEAILTLATNLTGVMMDHISESQLGRRTASITFGLSHLDIY